jgi:fructose-1,6-bisphosphatase/inositol monophosphatase family enzyme
MRSDVMDEVATVMRQAAAEAILPRYQTLLAGDVEEKTPGEVVTVADREAEQLISPRLAALQPGSRVVGEEAVAANPSLLDGLDDGHVWLVDPLDGTANFVAGSSSFSVMVALLKDGQTIASWLLDPVSGQLSVASRGDGAFIDGMRVRTSTASLSPLNAAAPCSHGSCRRSSRSKSRRERPVSRKCCREPNAPASIIPRSSRARRTS